MGMTPDQRELAGLAIAAIGQSQATIMHALTALAMECGEDNVPGIRESIDAFTEWLHTHHGMVARIESELPRLVVVVPPIDIEVL